MKNLFLTGLLLLSGYALASENVKTAEKSEESKPVKCTWCAKEGNETYCAEGETCSDAQRLLLEMAILH